MNAIPRRRFLRRTAAAFASVSIVPGHVLGLNGATPPSEKLNLAFVGVGGRGRTNLDELAKDCQVVALCDCDDRQAGKAYQAYPNAKRFKDYRKLLDEMGKDLDGVVISTPDHTHGAIALHAMQLKKHIYCEKPLAHSIDEVRRMVAAAREHKVITQMGNQGHATDDIRRFCEMIWSGAIGNVLEIHTRMERVLGAVKELESARKGEPVPAGLDWDLWLGPAQFRTYSPSYVPFKWRNWTAFGCGGLGDFVCHIVDPVFWALDLGAPSNIIAEPVDYDPKTQGETFSSANTYRFEFPAKANRPVVKLVWNDGEKPAPEIPEMKGERFPRIGALVIGEKGQIAYGTSGAKSCRLIPDDKMLEYTKNEKPPRIPKSPGHYKEWVEACKNGKPAASDFNFGGALTEIALLGMIALRYPGQKLEWDGAACRFTNLAAANQHLKPEFRKGWGV